MRVFKHGNTLQKLSINDTYQILVILRRLPGNVRG